jgi:signal peptidase I
MALWLFLTTLVLFQALLLLLTAASLWGSVVLLRAYRSARVMAILTAVVVGIGVAGNILGWAELPPTRVLVLINLAGVFLQVFAIRWILKVAWLRAIGVYVLYLVFVYAAVLLVVLAYTSTLVKSYAVTTDSMRPTLSIGDRFLVDRTATPRRWDVIAFRTPDDPEVVFVKRVAGMPGEIVEIIDGTVHINGVAARIPGGLNILYDGGPSQGPCNGCTGSPMTLGPGEFFVLGDDAVRSNDSRHWRTAAPGSQPGAVPQDHIIGVARLRYAPLRRMLILDTTSGE